MLAVTTTLDADISPWRDLCLQTCGPTTNPPHRSDYPLARHFYLVHVGDDGHVTRPYPQAKRILDRLKRLLEERPDDGTCAPSTRRQSGEDMRHAQTDGHREWHLWSASKRSGPLAQPVHVRQPAAMKESSLAAVILVVAFLVVLAR